MDAEWLYFGFIKYKRTLFTLAFGALLVMIGWLHASHQVQSIHSTGLMSQFDVILKDKAQGRVNKATWVGIALVFTSTWKVYKRDRKRDPFGF